MLAAHVTFNFTGWHGLLMPAFYPGGMMAGKHLDSLQVVGDAGAMPNRPSNPKRPRDMNQLEKEGGLHAVFFGPFRLPNGNAYAIFGAPESLKGIVRSFDADGDMNRVAAASEGDAFNGTHVVIVASPRQQNVCIAGYLVVRRIDVNPTQSRTIDREPGVGRIGADQRNVSRQRIGS